MVEGGEDTGSGSGHRVKTGPSCESAGGRLRFTVELRPGETTIVSWKKLTREAAANKPNKPGPSVSGPSAEAHQQPVAHAPAPPPPSMAPSSSMQPAENERKDSQAPAGPNRLSNVIERIERMYAGNGSSDEEDVVLDDVPDDDEYDTEDSFIDDTELDDYFQVDNSAIKHDGYFVNRGKLERIEPIINTNQQPKKRRRKDMSKGHGGSDDGHDPPKNLKIGNKGKRALLSTENSQSHRVARANLENEDAQFQSSSTNVPEVSLKKKTVDTKISLNPSGLSNGDSIRQKDTDQQRTGVPSLKNHNNKKVSGELQETSGRKSNDKSSYPSKSHSGKQASNAHELDRSLQRKEKGELVERFDLNVPASRDSMPTAKVPPVQRKDGATVRPKSSMLDKAIRELEKIVAESRPPSTEVQDPDNSAQVVKRRLPPEIKQKLAKVARYTQASYGKIPKDMINRLMSIVGHLVQLRTLKRNLNIMASMGLSAKQEKDDRLQKIKQEVAEMVKLKIPDMKSKLGQQHANSDDFQEPGPEEKDALKWRYAIDDALEDKICDLYNLYVERLEEHSGPPIRRLYEELAALWPSGVMDTDGIKRAIYRARDRRRAMVNRQKDEERTKKRKVVTPKAQDTSRGEATSAAQGSHIQEKSVLGSTLTSKLVPNSAIAHADTRLPVALANGPNVEKPRQEKTKGSSSSNPIDSMPMDVVPKKKVKRKLTPEAVEALSRLEKVVSLQAEEKPQMP